MKDIQIEYFFSTKSIVFLTIFLVVLSGIPILCFVAIFDKDKIGSYLSLLPLILFFTAIPKYVRTLLCLFKKKPAIIINNEFLQSSFNGKKYMWEDVQSIAFKSFSPASQAIGNYIGMKIRGSIWEVTIPHRMVNCDVFKLLHDLQKFHKRFHRQKLENSKIIT